jgi:hypothetical protein
MGKKFVIVSKFHALIGQEIEEVDPRRNPPVGQKTMRMRR